MIDTARCIACLTAFTPKAPHHRLCRCCYRWHAFGLALDRFIRTRSEPAATEVAQ